MSLKEQAALYDKQLQDCYDNPREYLDSSNYWREYRVSWKNYVHKTPTACYKHTRKQKDL